MGAVLTYEDLDDLEKNMTKESLQQGFLYCFLGCVAIRLLYML